MSIVENSRQSRSQLIHLPSKCVDLIRYLLLPLDLLELGLLRLSELTTVYPSLNFPHA